MKIKNLRMISQKRATGESRQAWLPQIAIALGVSLFGVLTAFGIAPGTLTETVKIRPIVAELPLPAFDEDQSDDTPYTRQSNVEQGDTVASLLSRLEVEDTDALKFLRTDPTGKAIFQLKPGRTVQAVATGGGELISLRYYNQQDSVLVVERDGDRFVAAEQSLVETPGLVFKTGVIRNSLFGATDDAGIPDAVATQLAKIFSTNIDFHSDLRRGDQFSVIYETIHEASGPVRPGRVLAAEFINNGTPYRAVYFESTPGDGDYYTPDGKNLRKAFLRSPLEFSRISSGFSMARFHPILRNWRAHTGVDFAAPTGTRMLATANGAVSFAGVRNSYGNVIEIRHQGEYSTLYAHLSSFAQSVRNGTQVKQGDVIGYVGATGLATGPHLHYEFKVAGVFRDPMSIAVPRAVPLQPQYQKAFAHAADGMQAKLASIRGSDLSLFE
jgi:murein DD-endopeptidase MepM/ murein hydrolase activator NlpD